MSNTKKYWSFTLNSVAIYGTSPTTRYDLLIESDNFPNTHAIIAWLGLPISGDHIAEGGLPELLTDFDSSTLSRNPDFTDEGMNVWRVTVTSV